MINATVFNTVIRASENKLSEAYNQVLGAPLNLDNQRVFHAHLQRKGYLMQGISTLLEHEFNSYKKIMESS